MKKGYHFRSNVIRLQEARKQYSLVLAAGFFASVSAMVLILLFSGMTVQLMGARPHLLGLFR